MNQITQSIFVSFKFGSELRPRGEGWRIACAADSMAYEYLVGAGGNFVRALYIWPYKFIRNIVGNWCRPKFRQRTSRQSNFRSIVSIFLPVIFSTLFIVHAVRIEHCVRHNARAQDSHKTLASDILRSIDIKRGRDAHKKHFRPLFLRWPVALPFGFCCSCVRVDVELLLLLLLFLWTLPFRQFAWHSVCVRKERLHNKIIKINIFFASKTKNIRFPAYVLSRHEIRVLSIFGVPVPVPVCAVVQLFFLFDFDSTLCTYFERVHTSRWAMIAKYVAAQACGPVCAYCVVGELILKNKADGHTPTHRYPAYAYRKYILVPAVLWPQHTDRIISNSISSFLFAHPSQPYIRIRNTTWNRLAFLMALRLMALLPNSHQIRSHVRDIEYTNQQDIASVGCSCVWLQLRLRSPWPCVWPKQTHYETIFHACPMARTYLAFAQFLFCPSENWARILIYPIVSNNNKTRRKKTETENAGREKFVPFILVYYMKICIELLRRRTIFSKSLRLPFQFLRPVFFFFSNREYFSIVAIRWHVPCRDLRMPHWRYGTVISMRMKMHVSRCCDDWLEQRFVATKQIENCMRFVVQVQHPPLNFPSSRNQPAMPLNVFRFFFCHWCAICWCE